MGEPRCVAQTAPLDHDGPWALGLALGAVSAKDEPMDALEEQLARVARKLRVVQQRPQGRKVLGEREHGFRLEPRLEEAEVQRFERSHGVALPEDYRAFVTRVGNGGAGPYYGLLPLQRWAAAPLEYLSDERPLPGDLLSRPSPLRDGLTGVDWVELLGGDVRSRRFDPGTWHPYQGTITLSHLGSTYYSLLIVTGPARGRVCSVDLDMQAPKFLPQRGFLDWYEAWLDEVLGGGDIRAFGYRH
jgi:SMI1/KNR4 family protein SUKH-1